MKLKQDRVGKDPVSCGTVRITVMLLFCRQGETPAVDLFV